MIRIIATINNEDTEVGLQPISCVLSMSINGVWIVKMEHPYDNEGRWQYITEDSVLHVDINCLDGVSSEQQYRITLCQRSLTSIYVEAYPIALDAFNDRVFTSVARNGATPSRLALDITSTAYPVTTNLPNTLLADYKYENTNLIAIINGGEDCFVEKYGGEIKYNNNAISINNRLDSGNTSYIYAGRDVMSLMHTINTSDVVTRIFPLSANGSRLNARSDAVVDPGTPYVDSDLINDYGVIHSEFINTNMMLCTEDENNADTACYNETMSMRNDVIATVAGWMSDLAHMSYVAGTKFNIEYLQSILKLTKSKDKNSGIIEKLQQTVTANIQNIAFKQMVSNWIKEACDEFDNLPVPTYELIKLQSNPDVYIYAPKNDHSRRVVKEWVRINNKWRWFGESGYLDPSYDNSASWSWWQRTGLSDSQKVYGSSADGIYLQEQWEKINGQWYWFKEDDGTHLGVSAQITSILNFLVEQFGVSDYADTVATMEKTLFSHMYTRMVNYSNWLYNQGVDKPKMEINLEAMDISQIEGYQTLQTLHLGNNVVFRNNGTNITERVVELEYDCIRKVNTRIVLGMPTETISAIISRNIETNPALIAGYGVNIDGNVINIAEGGGEVKGLRWWEETANHIERSITSIPSGGWTCDDAYLIQTPKTWMVDIDQGYAQDHFTHDGTKAIGAWMHFQYTTREYQGPVIISTSANAVKYTYDDDDNANESAFSTTISYAGLTWYVGGGNGSSIDTGAYTTTPAGGCNYNDNYVYSGDLPHIIHKYDNFYEAVLALLMGIANVRTRNSYITGINVGENYPFYGGYVASGNLTPENAPYKVNQNGDIYGREVICGSHILSHKQDEADAIKAIEIVYEDYEDLSQSEKMDATKVYFVKDYP